MTMGNIDVHHEPTFARRSEVVCGLREVDGGLWDLSVGGGCYGGDVRERVNSSGAPLTRISGAVETS
jgi:hypothetical protein